MYKPLPPEEVKKLYGYGVGDHIALVSRGQFDWEALEKVLRDYSCYPPALPKIKEQLTTKGQYDCFISASWVRSQYSNLKTHLSEVGIDLIVISLDPTDKRTPV